MQYCMPRKLYNRKLYIASQSLPTYKCLVHCGRVVPEMIRMLQPFITTLWVWNPDALLRIVVLQLFSKEMSP
jgi:hypothetical protein